MSTSIPKDATNNLAVSATELKLPLKQNPHSLRGDTERTLEVAIGREVRAIRRQLGITVADMAESSGLSLGMLSKIESITKWCFFPMIGQILTVVRITIWDDNC